MVTIIPTDEVEQGSEKWHQLRSQYCTGTDAFSILKGTPISEVLWNKAHSKPFHGNYYTQRGHDLEPDARYIYSQLYQPVDEAGFILNGLYPQAGYSPDGLVGTDGLVEIKCFGKERHLAVHENLDPGILAQIQMGLFVSERKWCDLINYNPDLEDPHQAFLVRRIYPDPQIQSKLSNIFKKEQLCR